MELDFNKLNGIIPVVIQDWNTLKVLMLGFMNREAYDKTVSEGYVTFYSRTKQRLWTKGETSGNYLVVKEIQTDCDDDSLLIKVNPKGNTCHLGRYSCFNEKKEASIGSGFLQELETLLRDRKEKMPEGSYTARLYDKGINKIAQKVGEEAVELVIEAKDQNKELLLNEAADLIYHMMVLLVYKGYSMEEVVEILKTRHK
jgi:phosphoribosyl-ATP pyrophosphohydrolase/phosphoribosyl-AMP cyclohydrolase